MATDESFFFFFWVLGKATDTKKELIRKVRSGRQDGWGVLLYPNGKQGLCQAAGLFCQTAVQNAQTLAYNCHFREKKKFAPFNFAEWKQRLGRLLSGISCSQLLSEKLMRGWAPLCADLCTHHGGILAGAGHSPIQSCQRPLQISSMSLSFR